MPRPPRIDFPDAVYHVTSRGNGRADIFHSDEDRQRFLAQLGHHLHHCAVDLYAFVLMDNHFHALVRTPRANLSRFMQRLLSSYALYARYKHHRPGHLFQGRFKAKLVEDEVYLLAVTRYIHLNPAKIAACRRLGA
jgi:REP element-mobilizing transposase RayT